MFDTDDEYDDEQEDAGEKTLSDSFVRKKVG